MEVSSSSKVVVVMPLYRSGLSANEHISIARCYELYAGKYDIIVVKPEGVDMTALGEEFPALQFIEVSPERMSSIQQYNKLLLSEDFYRLFVGYDYMLIYQADCFVFHDTLDEWIDRGYDYVGAPWYFSLGFAAPFKRLIGRILRAMRLYHGNGFRWGEVGNGGFSLRRVQSFIEHMQSRPNLSGRAKQGRLNEDIYWSLRAKGFRKPSASEASEFCGDMTPTLCPQNVMAAHGWNKNRETIEFWREKIEKTGTYFVENREDN